MEGDTKNRLFDRIIQNNDVFYRHQKKDEADIEVDEKLQILNDLFDQKPAIFLERYFNYIDKGLFSMFDYF